MNEHVHKREKGVKGFLKKVTNTRIEPGILADYKQEIAQYTRVFEVRTLAHYYLVLKTGIGRDQNLPDAATRRR